MGISKETMGWTIMLLKLLKLQLYKTTVVYSLKPCGPVISVNGTFSQLIMANLILIGHFSNKVSFIWMYIWAQDNALQRDIKIEEL
jgi:hypothetical protein